MGNCDRAVVAAALALALLAPGCSGGGHMFGGPAPGPTAASPPPPAPSGSPSLSNKVENFFAGSSDKAPQSVANAAADAECPLIEIREGASTLTIGPTAENGTPDAMALKYQGSFVRAARQCSVVAGQMMIKVGVQGRIIVGPAGGPGEVNVPLRIAVVSETPAGTKPIVTKLIIIPVTVASAVDSPVFTHIEDAISFPLPSSADLDHYVVYIGFDPLAEQAQEKPKEKPKLRPKPKPRPQAQAPAGTD